MKWNNDVKMTWKIVLMAVLGALAFAMCLRILWTEKAVNEVSENQNPNTIAPYHLVIDNLNPNAYVIKDSLLQKIQYVPLETSNASLIGQNDEIFITENYIVILDIYQTQSIFIFDRSGAFLHKIHRIGKGPGEFTQPSDIIVDEVNNQISLLHGFPSKIIKYALDGDLVGEIALPMRFRSFTLLPDGSYILVNEPSVRKYGNPAGNFNSIFSKLVVLTPSGELIHTGGPINKAYEENIGSNIHFGIIENQGRVSFRPCFSDTIFDISGHEVKPQFVVDFKEHFVVQAEVSGKDTDEYKKIGKENNYYRIYGRHTQTDQILVFTVHEMAKDLLYIVLNNKENGDKIIFQEIISNNPFNPANPIPTSAYDDFFVSIIDPVQFQKVKLNLQNYKDQLWDGALRFTPSQELIETIVENSNPVLAFYKLRPEKINMESVFVK